MNEHHYQRIDRGMKRKMRQEARRQPISPQGRFLSTVSAEKRLEVLLACPDALRAGETTTQIAERFGIEPRTLRAWLISEDTTEQARGEFLSHEIVARADQIELANGSLPLARARESFKAWSWIAERREARLFGMKQEVTHKGNIPVLNITIVQAGADEQLHIGVMSNPKPLISNETHIIDAEIVAPASQSKQVTDK